MAAKGFSKRIIMAKLSLLFTSRILDPIMCARLLMLDGRAAALPDAVAAFEALHADARGVVAAVVTTAAPMTAAQSRGVAEALRAALGKAPEIETRVDPALLGGIRVRVGSKLFDASLRSKLDSLKFALKRA
jgi:F-type H+-transporting ATPase subunit delta